MKHKLLLMGTSLLMMLMSFSLVNAQDRSVSGTINDENGLPLPGVSVVIKGTSKGGTTDFNGKFKVSIPKGEVILQLSYIGYELKEVPVTTQTALGVISLMPSAEELEEVIVIGYGSQKKSDRTGAVASVSQAQMNQGVMTDPVNLITGKVPGVSVSKSGGDPNGGFTVKIRGASGINSSTDPLYVVDGVPGVDPTTIATEDIATFNVLKDASSTAIYGARGANGVIIITTKNGKGAQGTVISAGAFYSVDMVAKRLDLLSASELRSFTSSNGLDFNDDGEPTFFDGGANTDWQDQIYQIGSNSNVNVSASGASDNANYRISLSHNDFKGVIKSSGKQRTLMRAVVNQKALDGKLELGGFLSGMIEDNQYIKYDGNGSRDVLWQAFRRNPTDPVYDEDGLNGYHQSTRLYDYTNPVSIINDLQNERQARNLTANVNAKLQLFDGLSVKVNAAYFRDDYESFYFEPSYSWPVTNGYAKRESQNESTELLESYLNYNKDFGMHSLSAVLGYSYQYDTKTGFFAQGRAATSDYVQSNNLGLLSEVSAGDIASWKETNTLISFFGRAEYNYASKYFLTGTVRRDGSSRFGVNNKWGIFPSVSAGWAIKDEFLKGVDVISEMKLRVGYGIVGNQEIGNNNSLDLLQATGGTDPQTGEPVRILYGERNPNPELKWEENEEINIGLDFGFFNDRLNGSLEVYSKATYDLMFEYLVDAPPNKWERTFANGGDIRNEGIELFLEGYVIDQDRFKWTSTLVFTKNKLTVESLSKGEYEQGNLEVGFVQGPGLSNVNSQTIMPEHPIGTFVMPEYAGQLSKNGEFFLYTAAGGVTTNYSAAERRVVGSAQPDFELSWSNMFDIGKGFDVSFNLRSVVGHDKLNVTKMVLGLPTLAPNSNVLKSAVADYNAGLRSQNAILSDYYLEDASFVRLENFTIGYSLDASKIDWLNSCRVYVTGNNLFTLTKYTGLDPEVSYHENGVAMNIDMYNVYPRTRSFTVGMNMSF